LIALTKFLILRKSRSGCLEERTALIPPIFNFFAGSCARLTKADIADFMAPLKLPKSHIILLPMTSRDEAAG
jgi:hypothetical protein